MTEDHYKLLNIFPADHSYLSHKEIQDSTNENWDFNRLVTLCNDLHYVDYLNGSLNSIGLRITDEGLEAKKNYEETELRQKEISELTFKKLKYDVKISERVVKTYPTTQIITWVTFAVMLILAFLKLAEVLHMWPYHK